jgi:hypothetical protein
MSKAEQTAMRQCWANMRKEIETAAGVALVRALAGYEAECRAKGFPESILEDVWREIRYGRV